MIHLKYNATCNIDWAPFNGVVRLFLVLFSALTFIVSLKPVTIGDHRFGG